MFSEETFSGNDILNDDDIQAKIYQTPPSSYHQ